MRAEILMPAAVLVLWTIVMLMWMGAVRYTGLRAAPKEDLRKLPRTGARGPDLDKILPDRINWVGHNYTHLLEQPTLFYAVVGILALTGQGNGLNAKLAWVYVAIRIAHSLWQVMVNTVQIRFGLFLLSALVLSALAINALRATL